MRLQVTVDDVLGHALQEKAQQLGFSVIVIPQSNYLKNSLIERYIV